MILINTKTGFLVFAEAESFKMSDSSPLLPFYLLLGHLVISAFVLCLCLLSFAAILRTKKTPYPTKLLSLGLLVYDCLFIISANGGKFFSHENNFLFRQLSRGFQMAAQLIVLFMAFERLFVLNRPYVFLRVGTRGRIRKVCIAIVILCFLQYILFQGLVCYARGKYVGCVVELAVYYLLICTVALACSAVSYIKIFSIIRNRSVGMVDLKQFKGTGASFVFLLNSAIAYGAYVGLSIYFAFMVANRTILTGQITNMTDVVYLVNCIVDSLIYIFWFKEARMEILNMCSKICHCLKPTVEKMRREVFDINKFRTVQTDKPTPSGRVNKPTDTKF